MPKQVCILGATGSVGLQTLDIIALNPKLYQLTAFSANTQVEKSLEIIKSFQPAIAVMACPSSAKTLQEQVCALGLNTEVIAGAKAIEMIAAIPEVDMVVAAIVGAAGLPGVLSAAQAGKRICLANKEALVMTGPLMMALAQQHQAEILPVDSEHNALFQCMPPGYQVGSRPNGVQKILLTASGGPFLETPLDHLATKTPEQACKHPNWSMGAKISVDSATMFNKGLEVIEASFLFDMAPDTIEVVIHPQSVIHSMVYYQDGSYLAQLGCPDMRVPISSAMSWPTRTQSGAGALDFVNMSLTFDKPCYQRFPGLALSTMALKEGGSAPCLLNAANEVAVSHFLQRELKFTQISEVVEAVLNKIPTEPVESLEQVLNYDKRARDTAQTIIQQL